MSLFIISPAPLSVSISQSFAVSKAVTSGTFWLIKRNFISCYTVTYSTFRNNHICVSFYISFNRNRTTFATIRHAPCASSTPMRVRSGLGRRHIVDVFRPQRTCLHKTAYVVLPVASLGLVSPGATTEGVTLFFPEKYWRSFLHASIIFCFHQGVTPWRVSPGTFFTCPTSFIHCSL